jgi:transcriptional regulator with XRE-family HTH domain
MAKNTALMAARRHAGLSQEQLARRIQLAGAKLGQPNECTRGTVHRWEQGTIPLPFYVTLLEAALNMPAEALGLDRDTMLAESGLDLMTPVPEPSARYNYGPLSGIWLSEYTYHSTSRDADFTSSHYCQVLQRGAHLDIRSLPGQHSRVSVDLAVNGQVATGKWAEQTSAEGYYGGALYSGAIQMHLDPTGRRLEGQWVGFGKDGRINNGPWKLSMVADKVSRETVSEWDREP